MSLIIEEEILYNMAFVAKTQNKFLEAKAGVIFHDMPNNRISPNGNHWLWHIIRNIPDSGPETAT